MIEVSTVPLFEHPECECCTYLGTTDVSTDYGGQDSIGKADWYGCTQGGRRVTIIARFSDEDSDYHSGQPHAEMMPEDDFEVTWVAMFNNYKKILGQ